MRLKAALAQEFSLFEIYDESEYVMNFLNIVVNVLKGVNVDITNAKFLQQNKTSKLTHRLTLWCRIHYRV